MRERRVPNLRRQLHASSARTDDHNRNRCRLAQRTARIGAYAGRQKTPMKALGIAQRVEHRRMLRDSRHAEIVRLAAHAQDQRVVGDDPLRQHGGAIIVQHGSELELALCAIKTGDRALHETKVMPMRNGQVVEIVRIGIHPTRRHFVQQRLPDMRCELINQRYVHSLATAVTIAEFGGERQASRSSANDNDAMRRGRRGLRHVQRTRRSRPSMSVCSDGNSGLRSTRFRHPGHAGRSAQAIAL